MILHSPKSKKIMGSILLPASKSISNRALILKALSEKNIILKSISGADDTQIMLKALTSKTKEIDIHHAGTCMRFLTAFFVATRQHKILTGSERMQQRPIKILVEALRSIGANITYLKKDGFPPIEIIPAELSGTQISLPANISSQYISALLLVASILPKGLHVNFETEKVSESYIKMTLSLLNEFGIEYKATKQAISIKKQLLKEVKFTIEADWSSASYWYSFMAFAEIGSQLSLKGLYKNSWQGDSIVKDIYKEFGVKTTFVDEGIIIEKVHHNHPKKFEFDFTNCPDIAQTIAITTAILCKKSTLTGLHTLNLKESKRIEALKTELNKIGVKTIATNNSISISNTEIYPPTEPFSTYNDHRMAMSLAPLSLIFKTIEIVEPEVVTKSYPNFWKDFNKKILDKKVKR